MSWLDAHVANQVGDTCDLAMLFSNSVQELNNLQSRMTSMLLPLLQDESGNKGLSQLSESTLIISPVHTSLAQTWQQASVRHSDADAVVLRWLLQRNSDASSYDDQGRLLTCLEFITSTSFVSPPPSSSLSLLSLSP